MEQAKASDENPVEEELPHEHGSPTLAARDGTTTSTHIGETSPATCRPNDGNQSGKEETPHEGDPPEPAAQVGTTTPAQFAEASPATSDNQAAKEELHHEDHASILAAIEAATASTHRTASSSYTGGANDANPTKPEKVLHQEDAAKTADQEATTPSTEITETSLTTGRPTGEDPPAALAAQPQVQQSQQTQTDGDGDIAVTATEVGNIPGADAPKSWWRWLIRRLLPSRFTGIQPQVQDERQAEEGGHVQATQDAIHLTQAAALRRAVYGWYWPLCSALRLVTDRQVVTLKWTIFYWFLLILTMFILLLPALKYLREFSCRSFRFNVGCVGLLLLIVGNAAWFIAVNLIELIGPHATKPFLKPIARWFDLHSPYFIIIDGVALLCNAFISAILIIGLLLLRRALSKAYEMFEAELENVFAKTATNFSEEAALDDFTRLHINLIALLNLSRLNIWRQYCIPFVIRADKAGERDPWNMVLVLWWYVMGTIVLVLVVNWLIDPLKKIVKLKIKLRQEESLYFYPTSEFHMVVRNMIASIEEAQVRPLSFRKMFFEFPLVTLVLFNLPFFLYVLNLR